MDQYELSLLRVLVYKQSDGTVVVAKGAQVYSITKNGIVLCVLNKRILIPWHNISEFTYDTADESARKAIQGF